LRRLFLSSSFKDAAGFFEDFAGAGLKGRTVTFIPTAALHEKVTFYVKAGRKALEKMGLLVEELEISTVAQEEIESKLDGNDMIYVSGGNTFFLLQELKRTGVDKLIKTQVEKGKIYIGESAGSIIAAPDIGYAKDMDDPKAAPWLENVKALQLVDFFPVPHYGCFPFKKAVEKIIAKHEAELPLMPISNTRAILVDGGSVRVVPEGTRPQK
jgi:dipeptidase E